VFPGTEDKLQHDMADPKDPSSVRQSTSAAVFGRADYRLTQSSLSESPNPWPAAQLKRDPTAVAGH